MQQITIEYNLKKKFYMFFHKARLKYSDINIDVIIIVCWHGRSHRVYINDTLSDQIALKCDVHVPQGSVPSASLYSMYAYPLPLLNIIKINPQYHKCTYADDTQIYIQRKDMLML